MTKAHITDLSLFERHLSERAILAKSTIYVYVKSVERFLIKNPDIDKPDDYNKFLIDVAIRKRSLHYYSALRAFIDYKIKDEHKKFKLLKEILKPKPKSDLMRERIHLDSSKILEVINNLDSKKHRTIALIQTITGVRAGDILSLIEGSIIPEVYEDREVIRINVLGKGKKRNVIFIHDKIAQHLIMDYITNHSGHDGYLFLELSDFRINNENKHNIFKIKTMNYQWFWADLKQALNATGVNKEEFATHDFRRCFARRVWEKYKDIHVLQSLLNHADPKTTLRYLEQSGLKNIDYLKEMQK